MAQVTFKDRTPAVIKRFWKTAKGTVVEATKYADKKFKANISQTDHSLKQLAELGHPYRPGGNIPHSPPWLIHKQSGRLLSEGVKKPEVMETADSVVGNFGFKEDPVAAALVLGTPDMIPRPATRGTLGQEEDEVGKILTEGFKKRYGGNVGISL